MAAEIVQIDTQDFTSQTYGGQDTNLISSFEVNTLLSSSSYIEYFVYDNNQTLLSTNYNFIQYTVLADGQSAGLDNTISQIIIDPEKSLIDSGYDQGEYITYFNFFNKQIGSELQQLYITEISSDRTEVRLDSTSLTDADIVEQANSLIQQREDSPYFLDFYLNFGDNQLAIANNIQLDNQDPTNPTILIKLYEALPEDFAINSTLWIVTLVEEPIAYKVTFEDIPIVITDTIPISGPNFNLDLKDKINNSTVSLDYTTLTSTALTSSQNQLKSLLEEKGLDINIDYTNFNDFIHFSSAEARLENFYYKMSLLEDYSSSIAILNNTTNNNPSASLAVYESLTSNIITNFDDYEYYLYYTSGSSAWPKTTSQPPYQLATTGSVAVDTWYDNIILSASNFDNLNQNNLYYSIPEYLRDDSANAPYQTFVEMVGQFYDNIWIYYKDVTQKYNADNRLEYGISKDIVADAIRDFGIKLYQNNFSNDDLYTAFIGLTPQGGLFPFPNITGSLPTPSGFEYVDTLISASNDYIPLDDVNKSLYKRIYHNLPYLLKSKGTLPGLRTLITSYGIPDTVLRINEFGGKDKSNTNDWDDWQNTFNYAYHNTGSNNLSTNWVLNSNWNSANNVPSTLEFRFKVPDLSTISGSSGVNLWNTNTNSRIRLRYTGSGLATGSYSGSIINPYYQFTHLDFFPDFSGNPSLSASVYLPFANEGWWSVMATRNGNDFKLYAGNNVYEGGENGTQLGFYATSSVTVDNGAWTTAATSQFMPQGTEMYLQEIRYYNTVLSESMFKDYIMNPYSSEGNSLNSSPDQLSFRLTLGGELYTGSFSIHPKITGSWVATSSFVTNSSASFASTPTFVPNTEHFFFDQPVVGIKNAISDKIRVENSVIPSGDTLSPFRSLAQNTAASQSYTANTNLLEVAFAPQDEINEDIISQIGYFNIGEYIGDPRQRSSSATSYPDLDRLRNEYFEKYTSNYDLNDYIRLIKYFDNSLFKMIKDFVPARTSLASGVIIKQTLLERNKYPQPQTNINSTIAYASSGSQNNIPLVFQDISVSGTIAPQWNDYQPGTIENFSGGTGGSFEPFNGINTSPYGPNGTGPENIYFITQSWTEGVVTPLGIAPTIHSSQDEFYNGEFSGSVLVVTTQSLAQAYPLDNTSLPYQQVLYFATLSGSSIPLDVIDESTFFNNFINSVTSPQNGEMLIFINTTQTFFPFAGNEYATTYFKIAKIDSLGNDNSTSLGQLDKILIYKSSTAQYVEYNLDIFSEYPTYYLYKVVPATYGSFPFVTADNKILNYNVSASIVNSLTFTSSFSFTPTESIDILNIYNSSSGLITFNYTPNTPIIVTASITLSTNNSPQFGTFSLRQGNDPSSIGNSTGITQNITLTSTPTTFAISGSLYPTNGGSYYLRYSYGAGGSPFTNTLGNLQLRITQSRTPNTPSSVSNILEPYITTPNYYNSDYNPLINNILVDRLSSIYQDVDYSTGIYTPTNFDLLISGSALKAAVQDSNYTSKRVILPRYEGSKSTSQVLNQWTPGDTGTYGKLPTVESLKTMVAYCDGIGGWPPERENASAAFVKYLIKADGTVVIPNTTPNSLADNQETFESGENVLVQFAGTGNQATPIRKIIRGGTRIEPILYTQYGQAPNSTWNTTMSFQDIVPSAVGAVGNYTAQFKRNSTQTIVNSNTDTKVLFTSAVFGSSYLSSNGYQVSVNAVQDGINLILNPSIRYQIEKDQGAGQILNTNWDYDVIIKIYKGTQPLYQHSFSSIIPSTVSAVEGTITFPNPITIPSANLVTGDIYSVYIQWDSEYISDTIFTVRQNSLFTINQYPAYTLPVTSSGTNSIWGWPNKTTYPYVITSSQTTLVDLYGDPGVKMSDITGSGFNPVILPWSIEYGDEFKFEGNESYVYQVGKVFAPADSGSGRITQTGSIEVHFNAALPISASNFNLDHFLIRRYVDEASQILIEGFAPLNSNGPYILKPEYVTPELDKGVDDFILILTERGLI
jgi:hypothetical protein